MQLTKHTDYALRLLIDLAGLDDEQSQIATVAEAQGISRTHLMKIANELARAGFIATARGRGGGIRLARPPEEINIGEVVDAMEPPCPLVECGGCRLITRCSLPGVLNEAATAFRETLSRYTLADVCRKPVRLPQRPAPAVAG